MVCREFWNKILATGAADYIRDKVYSTGLFNSSKIFLKNSSRPEGFGGAILAGKPLLEKEKTFSRYRSAKSTGIRRRSW